MADKIILSKNLPLDLSGVKTSDVIASNVSFGGPYDDGSVKTGESTLCFIFRIDSLMVLIDCILSRLASVVRCESFEIETGVDRLGCNDRSSMSREKIRVGRKG